MDAVRALLHRESAVEPRSGNAQQQLRNRDGERRAAHTELRYVDLDGHAGRRKRPAVRDEPRAYGQRPVPLPRPDVELPLGQLQANCAAVIDEFEGAVAYLETGDLWSGPSGV